EKNAACRVGVVSAEGGATDWLQVPDDARDNYIAFLEWAGNSNELIIQRLNRHQNIVRVMMGNATRARNERLQANPGAGFADGAIKIATETILEEKDSAWIDLQDEILWVHDGKEFLWLSERDGWRHIYRAGRDVRNKNIKGVTAGEFDVIQL